MTLFDLNPDQELWAARIRLHFEPHLRDAAEQVARAFVGVVGERMKELRPQTRMGEVLGWLKERQSLSGASLDWVELMMALEEEMASEITDAFAEQLEGHSFAELVAHLVENRRVDGSAA